MISRAVTVVLAACAVCAAAAALAAGGATTAFRDVLDTPVIESPLASQGLINGLARAGSRLVAVGQRGHVLVSDDDGKHWRQASVPVSSDLVAVHFPSATAGWAVGHDGVILHSADAGRSWKRQRDGRPDAADTPLLDVWFEDAKSGWAVGAFGLLLRTRDGGTHWESMPDSADNPKNMHLYAVRGIGDDLYIAGEQGVLLKLDRPSGRFRAIELPYKGTLFGLAGTGRVVLAHGLRGNVVRSTDGGATWQAANLGLPVGLTGSTQDAGGRILVASQAGHVFASSDEGATFTQVKLDRPVPASALLAVRGGLVVAGPRGVHARSLP
jgi:photosystem II stability/assembly factor-like uncharacterized protein